MNFLNFINRVGGVGGWAACWTLGQRGRSRMGCTGLDTVPGRQERGTNANPDREAPRQGSLGVGALL